MDWLSGLVELVDIAVTTLHVLAVLFLAYGAYLAVYRKDLWTKPERSEPERAVANRDGRHLHLRRTSEGREARSDGPAPAQRASGLRAPGPNA